ncbi:hypothetical protein ABPG75_001142 [Micractinium tetrahymenae]
MEVDQPAPNGEGQAMEVDENAAAAALPAAANPLSGEHTWELTAFSTRSGRVLSEPFEIGGYSWQLLAYPTGNNRNDALALYLAVAEDDQAAFGLQRSATFKLALLSSVEGGDIVKETQHTFTTRETDWGFTSYIPLVELRDPARGLLTNDTLRMKVIAEVRPPEDLQYDSRKQTGYVGLKNQGATCYMNSLLQTLFNINQFRKAVYHMPTSEDAEPASSMPLALQSVFYKLQFTAGPVSTKDLTRSFGWDTADAFQQHDVQELNRILCDRLEEKMKGTRVEGMINKLFEGHTLNYLECINVDYKSSRKESFMDVQLDVKGCKDIYTSFDKYCEVEVLDGDNQYNAEKHGMQDARKGILFESFPPVLQLQLKRFEYDFMKDMMIKINDRYEFYDTIELDREDGKYLSAGADRNVHNKYKLLAVLVHSGGVHGGHYYAYVRPDGKQWLKFDDERVEKADDQKAVEDNWGGDDERPPGGFGNFRLTKHANAYMLVYVRESEWDTVMCEVTEQDISDHVRARLKAEQEEKERRKKEKAEAHLYTLVRVSTDADLAGQIGSAHFFDLVDHDQVRTFKMARKAPFSELRRLVAEEMGVPPEKQRFWRWAQRQNSTYRPAQVLKLESEDQPISTIKEASMVRNMRPGVMATLNLFLETPAPPAVDLPPIRPKSDIMLFFKQYTPSREHPALKYAGRWLVPKDSKVKELHPLLRKLGGLGEGEAVEVYEEVKFEPNVMVDRLTPTMTLAAAQLEDGDILVFQQAVPQAEAAQMQCPTAKGFMEFVRNRQVVTFKPLDDSQGEEGTVELELSKADSYDDVSKALATKLGLDHPLKLRLTAQSHLTQLPRPHAMRYRQFECLQDMLKSGAFVQVSTLYYEVIDLPLPEYESLMNFKIAYHNRKLEEVSQHSVRISKTATIEQLLEELRRQLPAEAQDRPLRLMEVYQWKIWQLFDPRAHVETIGDNTWHLRVEVVPEDQEDLDQQDVLHAHCLQIGEEQVNGRPQAISDPFIMRIEKEETVGELRQRVQQQLGIPDEESENSWKPVLCTFGGTEALADDVQVSSRLDSQRLYGHQERNCIGFVHENKNVRRTHAHLNSRLAAWHGQEKQLKIRG